jgi:hypothetical protein
MRRSAWDVHARVKDMDLDGTWASLCFPSGAWGFTGRVLSMNEDQEIGLAAVRAWNSWMLEEWHGTYPERFIPMQLPWFKDPKVAGDEVRRNADLGFTSVSFLESPHLLKLPPITNHRHWEPFFKACEETDTVISLHCGASGFVLQGSPGAGLNVLRWSRSSPSQLGSSPSRANVRWDPLGFRRPAELGGSVRPGRSRGGGAPGWRDAWPRALEGYNAHGNEVVSTCLGRDDERSGRDSLVGGMQRWPGQRRLEASERIELAGAGERPDRDGARGRLSDDFREMLSDGRPEGRRRGEAERGEVEAWPAVNGAAHQPGELAVVVLASGFREAGGQREIVQDVAGRHGPAAAR